MSNEKAHLVHATEDATATPQAERRSRSTATKVKVGLLALAGSLLTLGLVGKHFSTCSHHGLPSQFYTPDPNFDAGKAFVAIPSTERLRENLWYYTSCTHVAGINRTQAVYTRDYFRSQGIHAEIVEYYPWLNYPVDQRVALFNTTTSEVLFEAGLKEDIIPGDPASEDPNNLPAFHGYSADGNVTGQLVYANYGSHEDFKALRAAGISVKDKIVLVRYGDVFRGLKVYGAELEGARGVLIYSDPADDGYVQGPVYPEGPWRPESSFQRGSVQRLSLYPGDPLTPGYASTKDAPRIDVDKAESLNHIPSLPLSYRDAEPLLRALKGQGKLAKEVGNNWVGGLTSKGVEYWTGPSELSVNLLNKVEYKNTPIQNVIARIEGWEEPNRVVLIGNHRDAWCAGASDPSSGSAALLELSRGFGELLKQGWRPRRTIILASWDAEEYGLVGSTEWVEEHQKLLGAEAVAYVNVDVAVRGSLFYSSASPLYKTLLYNVAKEVPYVDSNQTVYQHWVSEYKRKQTHHGKLHHRPGDRAPPISPLGSGSDYTAFNDFIGVSSVDLGFSGPGSVYHSNYDSFKFAETFTDPGFKIHKTLTQVWGLLTIRLADEPLVPFNPVLHAWDFKKYIDDLEHVILSKLSENGRDQSHRHHRQAKKAVRNLRRAQKKLLAAAHHYTFARNALVGKFGSDCTAVSGPRQKHCVEWKKDLNDKVSFYERHFLDEEGLPGRSWFKNVLVSPALWKGYGSQTLPGLTEAVGDGDWKRFKYLEKRTAKLAESAAKSLFSGKRQRGDKH